MLNKILYRSGRNIVDVYAQWMFGIDIMQHAPLPDGPKIVAANHPTTTDPFLITILEPDQMSILISETLFKVPLFGRYLSLAGHVPVVHSNGRPAFSGAMHLLQKGRTIGIFPEGAISPLGGGFHRPHTGAARLALISGAPVIPVGIHLDRERIHRIETEVEGKKEVGTWYIRGPYAMTVGSPMHLSGEVEDRDYVRAASRRIMQRIAYLSHESAERMAKGQRVSGTDWMRTISRWLGEGEAA